ncbi:MAG: carboxypeptidase regulatory-like domain-containing protein [Candidatus Zixiibacteriota bacterium]
MRTPFGQTLFKLGLLLLLTATSAFGQGDWTADLNFDPYPSPYISDWENNPAIGQALITNGTTNNVTVKVYLTIIHDSRGQIATANSKSFDFPPGSSSNLTTRDIVDDQSVEYDHSIKETAVRTGRLPEGKYRVCLRLETESGTLLLDNQCAEFTIVYPDPPYLVYPADGESVTSSMPVLQWTPVQVPVGYQVHYELLMSEVFEGQNPAQALAANYPQFKASNILNTSLQYPVDALSLQKGKTYAWQVQVLDDKGYPPSANNGRSEIWTFLCDVDTVPPLDLRQLAGYVVDASTGQKLASTRIVYRAVQRKVDNTDTTWTDRGDSIVVFTDQSGYFKIDSAINKSHYSLSASRPDYTPLRLVGPSQYQDGDNKNLTLKLSFAPPGTKRLAGTLKDFYSNDPVPNATVVYHVVDAKTSADSTRAGQLQLTENSRKALTTTTDAQGRFEFLQAADSSFFSLRASKTPSHLPAVDLGPDQRQVGDIDDYVLLIKPNAGSITGHVMTTIGNKPQPVSKATVRLVRSAVATVKVKYAFVSTATSKTLYDTVSAATYSDGAGFFKLQRINQEKPTVSSTHYIQIGWVSIPITTTITYQSYSYRILVNDNRYQPYLSRDSILVTAGETTESGDHELIPRSGSIFGRIRCDTTGVENAQVSLYRAVANQITPNEKNQGLNSKSRPATTMALSEGSEPLPAFDTTWGNTSLQRPTGEPIAYIQTDRTGTYIFDRVPINDPEQQTDRYTVWVEADGFNPSAKGVRVASENETDTVNVNLSRVGGVIFGKITSSDGPELSGVRVELRPADSSATDSSTQNVRWVASGGDGRFSLGDILPGLYRVSCSKSGFSSVLSDTFRIDYGDKLQVDQTLTAAKGFIALTVNDKDSKAVSDVCIKSPEIPSLLGFTDSEGKIVISGAVVGNVTLQLRKVGFADRDTTIAVATTDTMKVKLKIQKSVGQLIVRVVEKGNTSKRLEDMIVKIGKSGDDKAQVTDTTNNIGEVTFKEAPTGQQSVTVAPPTDTTYNLDYVVAETKVMVESGNNVQPVTVELEPAARISGTVKNKDDGKLLEGVTVSIEGSSKTKAITKATGVFLLRNVPAGETTTLVATKCGFKSLRFKYDRKIAVGDKVTNIELELEKSPMDSLFGFPIALDSVKTGSGGRNRVWGTLLQIPPTFGVKLADEATTLNFADVEVDSSYKPIPDSIRLTQSEVAVNLFGFDGKMTNDGGLSLEWIDSVKAGRICGAVTINDPVSKLFSETKFIDITIPKKEAPSFWAGGINRSLNRYGLLATDKEVQVQLKAVKLGIDFVKSHVDTAGLHFYGTIYFGTTYKVGFEEMLIGKGADGDITLKSITIKTKPAIKIPFGVFTVVDSSMTWEATGFRASGAIILNALDNREFGFKDLRISPSGEFLSLTVTADAKNGTIKVAGQQFQIEKLEFGTENFASTTLEHTKYFAFAGKLTMKSLEKPVGVSLRYSEKGIFTGKLDFNQSVSFAGVVTISLENIEVGYDSTKTEQFVGVSGGVKFGAINGLKLQASNLRFYFGGDVTFEKISMDFIAGPVQVKLSVGYANSVFEGKGLFEVKPVFSAGAEFRYGGTRDWWVRIISGTRIPIGPCEIVQASGGIGRKDDTWRFSVGGIVAPAKADKGIRLDILVDVQMTPRGVIILGNANVQVGNGTQIGRATLEINIPEKRVAGSIVFGMDFKALKASAQLDLCVKFDEFWYVYGRANIDVLKFFKADGVIIVANNWDWQHDGKVERMSGIYVELNSVFNVNANWYVVKWGVNFDRHAMVYIGWNGDFKGKIDMSGGAYAWIGFGPFDLINARADMGLTAHLSYIEPEWTAGARGHFSLQGSIGWCGNANCWTICWKCFIKIFGHCIFALPTGAKACIGMDAYIEYATSKGMSWSVSF